ncbi:hypothetical protein ACX80R_15235 [Paeniglutamicibacter antarcticus]
MTGSYREDCLARHELRHGALIVINDFLFRSASGARSDIPVFYKRFTLVVLDGVILQAHLEIDDPA